MLNEKGGSSHDPSAALPPAMWDRPVRQTEHKCRACANLSTGALDSPLFEVPRAFGDPLQAAAAQVEAKVGNLGPLAFICGRCDCAVPVGV